METGEYETNSLIINNIASITYRIYEPSPEQSQAFPSNAIEIESTLRDQGCIVSYDPNRRVIWIFYLTGKDDKGDGLGEKADSVIEAMGQSLVLAEEGTMEPTTLQRSRVPASSTAYTPTSSSSSGSALEHHQRTAFLSPSQPPGASQPELDNKLTNPSGGDIKVMQAAQTAQKSVYENFIAAMLLTITSAFCQQAGALPLNYRTVLLPNDGSTSHDSSGLHKEPDPILGDFRLYLTTTGALVISLSLHHCKGLLGLGSIVAAGLTTSSQPIVAAPFGVLAHKQHGAGELGSASLAHTPNTQTLSLRAGLDFAESIWKQSCLKFLQLRGMDSSRLEDCSWVNLLVSKRRLQDPNTDLKKVQNSASTAAIPWPGPLCFRKRVADISTTSLVGDNILSGHDESHDPLGYAGGWLTSAADRDDKLLKRKTDRTATLQKEVNGTDAGTAKLSAQSPLAFRRPSTTTAAGAMYPTPPDGIQQPSGVTPSLDGTVSSPGNPVPTAAIVDIEAPAPTGSAPDSFLPAEDFSEPKRERSDSNLLGDAENMFGDMDGDMFGDNDITEADFNFFDEQPGDVDLDLSLDGLEAMDVEQPQPVLAKAKEEEEAQPIVEEVIPEPAPQEDKAVFAKPELRHARSTLNDENKPVPQDGRLGSTKREPSPFDSQAVFKRVRASLIASKARRDAQPGSDHKKIFAKVELGPALSLINKKYEKGGLFHHDWLPRLEKPQLDAGGLPETDYLKRHGSSSRRKRERPTAVNSLIKALPTVDASTAHPTTMRMENHMSDGDDSSVASDQDDSSYTTDDPSSPLKSSIKPATIEDDAMSQVTSLRDVEPIEEADQNVVTELPRLSRPEAPEVSLVRLFADIEPLPLDPTLTDHDIVQIGQLLAEQAATGSLHIYNLPKDDTADLSFGKKRQMLCANARNSLRILEHVIPPLIGGPVTCQLTGLLDVQDIPLLGQPNRLQPRPVAGRDSNAEHLRPNSLYQIPSPHLEVRRSETKLSVLPSAVTFWESLGLAPAAGAKDVKAICVFPGWKGMADNIGVFLERMKSAYETLKLGSFENTPLPGDLQDGVLPYEIDRISTSPDATLTGHGSALVESVETLRAAVSELEVTQVNVLIYFVYSPSNPSTIIDSCIAFQRLFESYQKVLATRRETPKIELVLQLISIDMLSSPTGLVMNTPAELARMCMEIYDRCTLFTGPMPAPAIKLGQILPRMIDFKLMNPPSASLLHENSCVHVAYAQSVDDRWVSAAWTDDRGNQQATAAYCLARRGKPLSLTMHDVAHEIWESTLDLISVLKVHWRIIITKCSPMDQQEIDFWLDLARTEIKASVTVTLMTVDTAPSLQLIPPMVKPPPATMSFYSTPVSTPQAAVVSPEQSTATPATPMRDTGAASAATPGADNATDAEADSVLVDITDQTWGAVVGHRLSNSTTILDLQPTLASGYLIKRTGNRIEDPPVLMEVNLVHTDATPRAYEPLLREMLSYFRGLGTLARARGMVERETDVRPWHVAAAEKALKILYLLM